jgi:hypothetical protein
MRQRKWFSSLVYGGLFVIEITGGENGFHCHIHAIVFSRFLDVKRLSKEWKACSNGFIVYIQLVRNDEAIRYITKYLTKSTVSDGYAWDVSKALKGTRLFQSFGKFHDFKFPAINRMRCCPICKHSCFTLVDYPSYYEVKTVMILSPPEPDDGSVIALFKDTQKLLPLSA